MMQHAIISLGFAGLTATGLVLGEAAGKITGDTHTDLQTVGAIAAVVIPATIAIVRKSTKLEDRMKTMEDKLNQLYCIRNPDCARDKS